MKSNNLVRNWKQTYGSHYEETSIKSKEFIEQSGNGTRILSSNHKRCHLAIECSSLDTMLFVSIFVMTKDLFHSSVQNLGGELLDSKMQTQNDCYNSDSQDLLNISIKVSGASSQFLGVRHCRQFKKWIETSCMDC